ncbi:hypothetical protein BC936DRAFT_146966 [Jimgerdemannia flammicorona]|uniref:Uncharacterized protein n=1 Tax=Jimgerdemannia flammicorona TaxID=994334 RepID=A0A433D6E3_9FUNG|nr:hypothetical protein BC936DRAFT_146966 [Jimgerdemannia flammicorona]
MWEDLLESLWLYVTKDMGDRRCRSKDGHWYRSGHEKLRLTNIHDASPKSTLWPPLSFWTRFETCSPATLHTHYNHPKPGSRARPMTPYSALYGIQRRFTNRWKERGTFARPRRDDCAAEVMGPS